jgi:hypothetical protein
MDLAARPASIFGKGEAMLFKDPAHNPFTRENYNAPPSEHGKLGLWMAQRGLLSSLYIPSRWERFKLRGWAPFHLAIPAPDAGNTTGLWQLDANETEQYAAPCPIYYAIAGFVQWSSQPEGAQIQLFNVNAQQPLVSPGGPDLLLENLAGTGKRPFFFKKLLFLDPGDEILATITNLSPNPQVGQVAAIGFQPMFASDLGTPAYQQ